MSRTISLISTVTTGLFVLAAPSIASLLAAAPSALVVAAPSVGDARFDVERNVEIAASLERVERARAERFAAERNDEINASIATVERVRAVRFAAERNREINASIAAVAEVRFAAARNAEIRASIAAVVRARNSRQAELRRFAVKPAKAAAKAPKVSIVTGSIDVGLPYSN